MNVWYITMVFPVPSETFVATEVDAASDTDESARSLIEARRAIEQNMLSHTPRNGANGVHNDRDCN